MQHHQVVPLGRHQVALAQQLSLLVPQASAHQPALQPSVKLRPRLLAALALAAALLPLASPQRLDKAALLLLVRLAHLPLAPAALAHPALLLGPLKAPQPLGRPPPLTPLGQAQHRHLAAAGLAALVSAARHKAHLPLAHHKAHLLSAALGLVAQALGSPAPLLLALVNPQRLCLGRAAHLRLALPQEAALVRHSPPLHLGLQPLPVASEPQHLLLAAALCSANSSSNKPNQLLALPVAAASLGNLVLQLASVISARQLLGRASLAAFLVSALRLDSARLLAPLGSQV